MGANGTEEREVERDMKLDGGGKYLHAIMLTYAYQNIYETVRPATKTRFIGEK